MIPTSKPHYMLHIQSTPMQITRKSPPELVRVTRQEAVRDSYDSATPAYLRYLVPIPQAEFGHPLSVSLESWSPYLGLGCTR